MNSFACLCPGVLFQYEALDLASQSEILDSHFLFVTPQMVLGSLRLLLWPVNRPFRCLPRLRAPVSTISGPCFYLKALSSFPDIARRAFRLYWNTEPLARRLPVADYVSVCAIEKLFEIDLGIFIYSKHFRLKDGCVGSFRACLIMHFGP